MTTDLYAKGKQKFLSGGINLTINPIKACLVSSAYTPNLETHEFYSDVVSNLLGDPQALTSVTATGGVFNANSVVFVAVTGGDTVKAIVLYKDTGVAGTSPLIAYLDNFTGLPLATNGGNITANWDTGASKIFAL